MLRATARLARDLNLLIVHSLHASLIANDAPGGRVPRTHRCRSELRNCFTKICEVFKFKIVQYYRVERVYL